MIYPLIGFLVFAGNVRISGNPPGLTGGFKIHEGVEKVGETAYFRKYHIN